MQDANEFLPAAINAATSAGEVLQDWAGRITAREKSRFNLVTEADFAAQDVIHQQLSQAFPDHGFLGEEGLQEPSSGAPYRWIVDPLDGTSNYVHGFPYYCVSIGLELANELILGVIFDPTRNECFTAVKGGGAKLNGQPITPSETETFSLVMAAASLPINATREDPAIKRFLHAMPHVQTVQRLGSAALNLCAVASGRMETFWSTSLKPWDMAAGVIIVREAGGIVTTVEGGEFDVNKPNLLASNNRVINQQLVEMFAGMEEQ